ncbi:MAG: tetratricopeptide repeat protein [Gammaproteobacteria bacterium]
MITALLIMFPFVVVLSWTYDFSFSGIRRTTGDLDTGFTTRRWFRGGVVAVTGAICASAIWWVWSSEILQDENFTKDPDDEFPKIVAVADFKSIVGEGSEWLGDGIANLVRDNLAQSKFLRLVSPRRWQAVTRSGSEEEVLAVAAAAGIRYVLQGEVIGSRSGFLLTVRLMDTADGEQLDARTFEAADVPLALEKATAIAQATRAELQVPIQERVDVYSADFAADNPGAYRAFVAALEYWINFDFADAERMLKGALELQPDYPMARYYLAWVQTVQDRPAEARDNLAIAADADSLSDRDRLFIDALAPLIDRDMETAQEAYSRLLEQYPYESEAINLYAEVLEHLGHNEDAIAQYQRLSQLEPEVQLGWSGMGNVNLRLGRYDEAAPAIDRFASLAPDNPNAFVLKGDLARARNRLQEAREHYQTAIDKGPDLQEAIVSLATVDYLLGDVDSALYTLDALIMDGDAIPRYRIDALFAAGGILDSLGQFQRHVAYIDALDAEIRSSEVVVAKALTDKALAILQAKGPTPEVSTLIDNAMALSPGVPTRYLFARGLVELRRSDFDAVVGTANEIRAHSLPAGNPDRTEEKAADYLQGRVAMAQGDYRAAVSVLSTAVDREGYSYRLYELALAEAQLGTGSVDEAIARLERISTITDPNDPRLDLELDRAMARLRLAEGYFARQQIQQAGGILDALRLRWADADPGFAGVDALEQMPGNN